MTIELDPRRVRIVAQGRAAGKTWEQLADEVGDITGKGAFTPLLSGIPVKVVMEPKVGLRGALRVAAGTVRDVEA